MAAGRSIAVILLLLLLSGCWDKKELNEMAVVIGAGVDQGDNGHFRVTAQVIKPEAQGPSTGAGGSELPTWSVTAEGDTFMDAITELNRVSPRRLYWPHLQIVVFGEALAREGIAPVITWFEKARDSRSGTFVAVTRGSAEELLNQKIELGNVSSKAMADLLGNAQVRQLPARQMTLRRLMAILSSPGIDVAVDVIDPKEIRGKVETYELVGAAYFKGGKLAGIVSNEAVHGLAIASDTYANATIKAVCPKSENTFIMFQVTDYDSKLKVTAKGNKITGTFDIFVEGNLLDQSCLGQLLEPEAMRLVEKEVSNKIEKMLMSMFTQASEAGSDVYGIGQELRRHHPGKWHEVSGEWEERLKDVHLEVKIDANIRRSGLVIDPTINKMEER
jgi:spore germination protein KC